MNLIAEFQESLFFFRFKEFYINIESRIFYIIIGLILKCGSFHLGDELAILQKI